VIYLLFAVDGEIGRQTDRQIIQTSSDTYRNLRSSRDQSND